MTWQVRAGLDGRTDGQAACAHHIGHAGPHVVTSHGLCREHVQSLPHVLYDMVPARAGFRRAALRHTGARRTQHPNPHPPLNPSHRHTGLSGSPVAQARVERRTRTLTHTLPFTLTLSPSRRAGTRIRRLPRWQLPVAAHRHDGASAPRNRPRLFEGHFLDDARAAGQPVGDAHARAARRAAISRGDALARTSGARRRRGQNGRAAADALSRSEWGAAPAV
jgi:hypothetical protein